MYASEILMVAQTYNIELLTTDSSFQFWFQYLSQAQEAWNTCAYLLDELDVLNLHTAHEAVYDKLRKQFDTLPAQAIIKIYKEVIAALRSIRSNKHKNADVPQRKSLSMRIDKRLYSNLSVEGIALTGEVKNKRTFYSFVKYPKMEEMFSKYIAKDPLLFIRDGRLYLSVPFEVPELPTQGDTCLGVDLGMKRLFVTSEGVAFRDKQYLKERRKLRYLKRCLQSKGTKSAKRHLKKVKNEERNLSKDMCYRASNALLASTDASVIVLEDLSKIKQKTSKTKEGYKRTKHNSALSQVPFYKFKEILTHKAALVGKRVVTVNPSYTSQTDSRTQKKEGNRKGCRFYGVDGIVLDADWNAAVNIAQRSKHPLTIKCYPLDGTLKFFSGRELSTSQSSKIQKNLMDKPLNL